MKTETSTLTSLYAVYQLIVFTLSIDPETAYKPSKYNSETLRL
jgi:hypothetical protein